MKSEKVNPLIEVLETSYTGARLMDDAFAMISISRAIAALKAPVEMEIFTDYFKEWYQQNEVTS